MRLLAQTISFIFHPVFLLLYLLLILLQVNPFIFGGLEPKLKGLVIIQVAITTCIFPLIATGLMKALGLIPSLEMHHRKDRIGPLIATAVFYIWLYLNIKDHDFIPDVFASIVLGSCLALCLSFFINVFSKISLHTVGLGGAMGALILIYALYSYETFWIWGVVVSVKLVLMIALMIAGLVGTARLYLGAHQDDEIYGGYLVGLFGQLVAFVIVL